MKILHRGQNHPILRKDGIYIMRRILAFALSLLSACTLTACTAASSEERTGSAQGYGGMLTVKVTTSEGAISDVKITEHSETEGVGTRAIDALPDAIVTAGTWDVDGVSGATVTSNAIKAAVASAMGEVPSASPDGTPETSAQPESTGEIRSGMGMAATGRVGPGKDDQGNPVYSFNVVFAAGQFDGEGRVISLQVDQLEVATPNYDGASMPHFSGFPGQGGYALWDDAQGKVSGTTGDTEEDFLAEVSSWTSKRARGESYALGHGSWRSQMDAYQAMMEGKTIEEIEAWFAKYFSPATGKPLHNGSDDPEQQQLYDALSDEEKSTLADVTSGATMSLRDAHGDILLAIRRAWEDAQE